MGARDEELLSLELAAPLPHLLENRGGDPDEPLLELHQPAVQPGSSIRQFEL